MIDWILSHLDLLWTILSCLLALISFILMNKSNKRNNKLLRVFQVLPVIIDEAEQLFQALKGSGDSKLKYVLEKLQVICTEVNINYDEDFWKQQIENMLSTPQKK